MLENNLDEHFHQTRRSHDRNLAKACLLAIYLFCFLEDYPTDTISKLIIA